MNKSLEAFLRIGGSIGAASTIAGCGRETVSNQDILDAVQNVPTPVCSPDFREPQVDPTSVPTATSLPSSTESGASASVEILSVSPDLQYARVKASVIVPSWLVLADRGGDRILGWAYAEPGVYEFVDVFFDDRVEGVDPDEVEARIYVEKDNPDNFSRDFDMQVYPNEGG